MPNREPINPQKITVGDIGRLPLLWILGAVLAIAGAGFGVGRYLEDQSHSGSAQDAAAQAVINFGVVEQEARIKALEQKLDRKPEEGKRESIQNEIASARERLAKLRSKLATAGRAHVGNIGAFFVNWNPPLCAAAERPYTYTVLAADADGDPLAMRLTDAPPGMQLTQVMELGAITIAAGVIEWHPSLEHARAEPYKVTVTVSDPDLSDSTHTISRVFPVVVADWK